MSFLRALKLILTLRCEGSIRFMSELQDSQIPWAQRWAYRLHLIGCVPCRQFRRQIGFIRRAARRRGQEEHAAPMVVKLSQQTRDRILASIQADGH